jgi:DNA-binding CsgD family transcriptional regulator
MPPHTKTAPKARKRATGPSKAQEFEPAKASEEAPTEKPMPVVIQGVTALTIPEDRAKAIAAAHMAGMSIREICQQFNCSHHTIAALIRNRPELLAAAREITANNWRTLAALGSASLIDRMPDMKDHALTVMTAIATEKAELLSGGATSRVEVIAAPAVDEWSDVVDGVVVESSAVSIGNASRTAAPKGPTPPPPALVDRPSGEQPPAFECSDTVGSDGVSVFEPVEAPFLPPPPPTDRGGAGVASSSKRSLPNSLTDDEIFRKST